MHVSGSHAMLEDAHDLRSIFSCTCTYVPPPVLRCQGREKSSPDHRRYSMLDPSATETEVARLRQRLLSTEEALRNALEHNQEVDQLVEAMRTRPDKGQVKI